MEIRAEQIEAIKRAQLQDRLPRLLREAMPERTHALSDAELHQEIDGGIRDAAEYGIQSERGIAQFLILRLATHPSFDEEPAISHYLTLPGIDPDHKIATLLDFVIERLQAERSV